MIGLSEGTEMSKFAIANLLAGHIIVNNAKYAHLYTTHCVYTYWTKTIRQRFMYASETFGIFLDLGSVSSHFGYWIIRFQFSFECINW